MRVSSLGGSSQLYESRKFTRHLVKKPTRIRSSGIEAEGELIDVSRSGVAFQSPQQFDNNLFVELQIEGANPLAGRVVRQFPGGFALQFDEADQLDDKALEEIAKFRAIQGADLV